MNELNDGNRTNSGPEVMTRRRYLTIKALMSGAGPFVATEAVASTALEHPEWDMEQEQTWDEWERSS